MQKNALSYAFERLVLCIGLFLFFLGTYFGLALFNLDRAPAIVAWDPVYGFPFWPPAIALYLTAYAAPFAVALGLPDRRRLHAFLIGAVLLVAISALGFVAWPLVILRPAVTGSGLFDRLLAWFYELDPPTNLFPSLHVSMAFFSAGVFSLAHRHYRLPVYAWATVVALSTLFTRQHYLIDLAGGLLAALLVFYFYKKRTA